MLDFRSFEVALKGSVCYGFYSMSEIDATLQRQPQENGMLMRLPLNPKEISLEDGFSQNVGDIGHPRSGNPELAIRDMNPLIQKNVDVN